MQIRITNRLNEINEAYELLEAINELSQLVLENFDNNQEYLKKDYLKNLLIELKWQMENEYARFVHHEYQKYSTDELKEMRATEKTKNGETIYYNELDFEIHQRENLRTPVFIKKTWSDYASE